MGLIRVILLAVSLFDITLARAATVETCDQYRGVTVGPYVIQTDYWNQGQCPGTQCMSIDDQTGVFTVTKATYQCGYSVGGYPSILYGKAFGGQSPGSGLPARVDSLKCVHSSWTFHPSDTGRWDAAYDIWLCPDNQCGPGGFPGGAEVMVWLDYRNTNGWQVDQGPVTLNGMPWEVWRWDVDDAGGKRTYVAYLAKTKTDSVKNLDLLEFLKDSQARGYLKPSWYLYAVLAGVEIASGGVPFTSESYSVSLNGDCGVAPQILPIPASPTPTPDLTPEDIPPPP